MLCVLCDGAAQNTQHKTSFQSQANWRKNQQILSELPDEYLYVFAGLFVIDRDKKWTLWIRGLVQGQDNLVDGSVLHARNAISESPEKPGCQPDGQRKAQCNPLRRMARALLDALMQPARGARLPCQDDQGKPEGEGQAGA